MSALVQDCSVVETAPTAELHPAFASAVRHIDGRTWIALEGELDIAAAPTLRCLLYACADRGLGEIIVDMSGLEFIDVRGLSVLLDSNRHLAERQRRLTLAFPSPQARHLLELTGLSGSFSVRPSLSPAHV